MGLSNIIPSSDKVAKKLRYGNKDSGYDTVVFSGGGIKGIAMLGACGCLTRGNHFNNAKNFIGTSVGAIVAAVLAMRLSPEDVFTNNVLPFRWKHNIDLGLLERGFGFDSGSALDAWLASVFDTSLTFRDVMELYGTRLVVTVTNLNTYNPEYFDSDTTPDFPVVQALRMSCSVPIYFSAIKYRGNLYVDGGIADNFPLEQARVIGGKNIFGIRFITEPKHPGTPWSLESFLGALLESSLNGKPLRHGATVLDIRCGPSTQPLDFKIPNNAKCALYNDGYIQAKEFMKKIV